MDAFQTGDRIYDPMMDSDGVVIGIKTTLYGEFLEIWLKRTDAIFAISRAYAQTQGFARSKAEALELSALEAIWRLPTREGR